MTCHYFAAFCLPMPRAADEGPRIGFTLPRAFGKANKRNRAKRRLRELLRVRLGQLDPHLDLVINPRRPALDALPRDLQREIERLISRCNQL
jgi:ribonuclease P protein component